MKTPLTCAQQKHGNRDDRKLRFLKIYRDRHGRVRHYFRRAGRPDIPLPGAPHSVEFMAAYARLCDETVKIGRAAGMPYGSVSAAIADYYLDQSFTALAASTQGMRRRILEKLRAVIGPHQLKDLSRGHLNSAFLGQLPPFERNNWIKTLRGLMKFALGRELISSDPTAGITKSAATGGSIHTWTEEEIAQYRRSHALGTVARLALELLLNTAQGRADVVRMGPKMVEHDRETGWPVIVIGRKKTKMEKQDRPLFIPILPDLQAAIDATPTGQSTFLVHDGGPYTDKGLGTRFAEWREQAGLPKGRSSHGLRKAGLVRLAEAGCSEEQLRAISGHQNAAELKPYIEKANQRRLALSAMGKLLAEQNRNKGSVVGFESSKKQHPAPEQSADKVSNRFRKIV
jgi:integrase